MHRPCHIPVYFQGSSTPQTEEFTLDPIRFIAINRTAIPKQRAVTYIMQNAWYGILR